MITLALANSRRADETKDIQKACSALSSSSYALLGSLIMQHHPYWPTAPGTGCVRRHECMFAMEHY